MRTPQSSYRISIIGLGYIGLPTAALFASQGHQVIGVDVNGAVVDTINSGNVHIVEPELDGIVHKAVASGALRATISPEAADVFVIAVPTPIRANHQPELSYIHSAIKMIAPKLVPGNLVILESTSPVGTTRKMAGWLATERPDLALPLDGSKDADVHLAYCPERVLPGNVVRELVENDRIIGGMTATATERALAFYRLVVRGVCATTTAETAEMCKLVENSSRDVQIAFANELSIICDQFGVNVWDLIDLANRHPRVNILRPGPGVGGHCIAVDPWFLIAAAPDKAKLIRQAREVNDSKPDWVLKQIKITISDVLSQNPTRSMADIRVACLGLAFKPDIDDLRESPALAITEKVAKLGCQILAVEPNISDQAEVLKELAASYCKIDTALQDADIVCVLVKHSAFVPFRDQIGACSQLVDVVGLTGAG